MGSRGSLWYSAGAIATLSRRSSPMPEAVYRMLVLLCTLVAPLPIGTNLGLLHLLWMLISGHLLATRGPVIPGLGGPGPRWGRGTGRARDCWPNGAGWWPRKGAGTPTPTAALTRWRSL